MKKTISFIAIAACCLLSAISADAQIVGSKSSSITTTTVAKNNDYSNYSRLYLGYTSPKLRYEDESVSGNGVTLGWATGINLTGYKLPLYLEVGVEADYSNFKEGKSSIDIVDIDVPINVVYKFTIPSTSISIAPLAGLNAKVVALANGNGENMYSNNDVVKRFMLGYNLGFDVYFSKFSVFYRFQNDFMPFINYDSEKVYLKKNVIGFSFVF